MDNRLNIMLLNDIEDQIKDMFSGNELITLTNEFAKSVGENVTIQVVGFNSKKDILSKNISDMSDNAKIKFFDQLKTIERVSDNPKLVMKIDELIASKLPLIENTRNNITNLLSDYSSNITTAWKESVIFYNDQKYRGALDSIRLTLELLLKKLLGNDKSLENQKALLGKFLKEHNVSIQFVNLFLRELDMYEKIQNDEVKNNIPEHLSKKEIEFLMNQAVLIIKFLDRCNNEEK